MESLSTGTVAFLFTDLEGSTRLWETHPEAMAVALKRHDAILRSAIEAAGGQVVKTTGDGMMAVFESACDAVAASLVTQRTMAGEAWGETGPLRIRMGVHAGQAEQRGGDYFGPTVNRTARIMAAGHGGQVLLSGSAAALAEERLPAGAGMLDLGEHRLKDLGRPEHIFQLIHPDLAGSFPPLSAVRPAGAALPARAADLIGRQAELAQIGARLADASVRLLTLIGPGGTGKTTLAVRVAESATADFPDGVTFVDLSVARDTNAVLIAIARAVGLGDVVDRPLLDELIARLRDCSALLVLDNLEQVTHAAGTVAQLIRDCPRVKILATSREALHVRAEQVFPVPPLGLPPTGSGRTSAALAGGFEAVQLFVDRARAVRPDFDLTDDNAAAVVEICRRLDGLPLAIELAAARLRLFSPEALRDRLGDRLGLLRSGPRDLPERQQTLRATMDWSYELLEPAEQRLFEFLSVFAEAEIAAVESVAESVEIPGGIVLDVLDGLAGLTEKSLVRQVDVPGGEPRVTMLETIREFAGDRLGQHPDFAAEARRAHATHYADLARKLRPDLTGSRRESALAAMAADVANLRHAWLHWAAERDLEQLEKLADSLLILNDARGWYLDTVGLTTDLLAVLEAGPSSPEMVGREIALRTSLARALMTTRGFTPEVEEAFTSVVELFERSGDVVRQVGMLRGLASLYVFQARFDKTTQLAREILDLGERQGDPKMQIDGHLLLGTTVMTLSDLDAGLAHFETAIALFEGGPTYPTTARVGNDPRISSYTTAGLALWLLGFPDRAVERTDAALALAGVLDHPFTTAYARFHAGLLRLWRREWQPAADLATGLLEVADEFAFRMWTAAGSCLLGAAQVGLGSADEGLGNIRDGMALYQELRSPPVFWPFLLFVDAGAHAGADRPAEGMTRIDAAIEIMSMGDGTTVLPELHLLKGDLVAALAAESGSAGSDAEEWYRRALGRAEQLNARMTVLRASTRLARILGARGETEAAADLLGPVHAAFTEGFGTTDFREATEVLRSVTPGRTTPTAE